MSQTQATGPTRSQLLPTQADALASRRSTCDREREEERERERRGGDGKVISDLADPHIAVLAVSPFPPTPRQRRARREPAPAADQGLDRREREIPAVAAQGHSAVA